MKVTLLVPGSRGLVSGFVKQYLLKLLVSLLIATGAASAQAQTVVEYIHTDALGTPVAVTNAAGAVIERSVYEPFGQLINRPLTDGPGFSGHVQDAATGLTYMQQRYYDPAIGRFLSVDPVTANSGTGSNFNRYWYAHNNPYKFTDPDGREVVWTFQNGATVLDAAQTMMHLALSPTASGEISQITNSSETYTLSFDRGPDAIMGYDETSRTVTSNPTSGLRVGSGKIQSPAIGTGHEISHAAEHDRIGTEKMQANLEAPVLKSEATPNGGMSFTYGASQEERRATSVETNIANERGEATRKSYTDEKGAVTTCGATSTKEC